MERTLIKNLGDNKGKEVIINGWVHVARNQGKMAFFDFRDRSGLVQGVVFGKPEVLEIAKKLNRPVLGIHYISARLGFSNVPEKRQLWIRGNTETHFTEDEKKFIRNNYLKMTNEQIAEKLMRMHPYGKRSGSGIARMINVLGLSGHPKRRAYIKKIKRIQSK